MHNSIATSSARRALWSLAVAALLVAAPAAADDWSAKWSNGFKVESEDGDFKLKFGGRIMADFTLASADDPVEQAFGLENFQDGFEFRRARLFFSGTIYQRVEFKAQYDFAGGDASFKDVWIALNNDWGSVKFGHFKEPFSLEELTSSKYLAFLERSLPIEAFAPSRNSGIGVEGSNGDRFNWGLGYFFDADDFGVSADEDRTNITGRIGFRPLYEDGGRRMIHVGLSATSKDLETDGRFRFRARPEAHFTTRLVNTDNFAADSALVTDLELAGVFEKFWFAGEYLVNDVDAPQFGDPSFSGYYAQAGYFLTDDYRRFKAGDGAFDRQKPKSNWLKDGGTGAWEVAIRFSSIDLTDAGVFGGEQDDVTVALNWYPNPATRMMLNFVTADVDGLGDANFVLLRWQVDF